MFVSSVYMNASGQSDYTIFMYETTIKKTLLSSIQQRNNAITLEDKRTNTYVKRVVKQHRLISHASKLDYLYLFLACSFLSFLDIFLFLFRSSCVSCCFVSFLMIFFSHSLFYGTRTVT